VNVPVAITPLPEVLLTQVTPVPVLCKICPDVPGEFVLSKNLYFKYKSCIANLQ
jgi:hypothetical protein